MIKTASSSDKNGDRANFLALVVEKMDSTIHWISIWKTNCAIHWIVIYPVDSAIQLLNNWDQKGKTLIKTIIEYFSQVVIDAGLDYAQDINKITANLSLNGHLVKCRLIFVTNRRILMNIK